MKKICFVPGCTSTKATPGVRFFCLPQNAHRRKQWCSVVGRKNVPIGKSHYCCSKHFNLEQDLENWYRYRLSKNVLPRFKPHVVPHIFNEIKGREIKQETFEDVRAVLEVEIKQETFEDAQIESEVSSPPVETSDESEFILRGIAPTEHGKKCFVPGCTSIKGMPGLIFFSLPNNIDRRKRWCSVVGRSYVPAGRSHYCCSKHFKLPTWTPEEVTSFIDKYISQPPIDLKDSFQVANLDTSEEYPSFISPKYCQGSPQTIQRADFDF